MEESREKKLLRPSTSASAASRSNERKIAIVTQRYIIALFEIKANWDQDYAGKCSTHLSAEVDENTGTMPIYFHACQFIAEHRHDSSTERETDTLSKR